MLIVPKNNPQAQESAVKAAQDGKARLFYVHQIRPGVIAKMPIREQERRDFDEPEAA